VTSRALATLAACLSPIFMVAAAVLWVAGLLPATPLVLAIATVVVLSGPLLGIVHVATAWEPGIDREPSRRVRALAQVTEARALSAEPRTNTTFTRAEPAAPARPNELYGQRLTPMAASARSFHNWREKQHPVLTAREREERLEANARRARELRRMRFHNA
jgi:hypothetical protein